MLKKDIWKGKEIQQNIEKKKEEEKTLLMNVQWMIKKAGED